MPEVVLRPLYTTGSAIPVKRQGDKEFRTLYAGRDHLLRIAGLKEVKKMIIKQFA